MRDLTIMLSGGPCSGEVMEPVPDDVVFVRVGGKTHGYVFTRVEAEHPMVQGHYAVYVHGVGCGRWCRNG